MEVDVGHLERKTPPDFMMNRKGILKPHPTSLGKVKRKASHDPSLIRRGNHRVWRLVVEVKIKAMAVLFQA